MFKLFVLAFCIFSGAIVSIYSLTVPDLDKNTISLNNYRNKTILIVNTATGSNGVGQLTQLQQLYMQHKDSMVVIAFPTNSFGHEPRTDQELKIFMQGTYGITFPIVSKSPVKGDSANILYQWLSRKMDNDVMDAKATRDFQKFLIDKSGNLVGKFDSSVSPLSQAIQEAIHFN